MTTLMNKPVTELTVSDSLKINAAALAIMATPFVAMVGFDIVKGKFSDWRTNRDAKKILNNLEN